MRASRFGTSIEQDMRGRQGWAEITPRGVPTIEARKSKSSLEFMQMRPRANCTPNSGSERLLLHCRVSVVAWSEPRSEALRLRHTLDWWRQLTAGAGLCSPREWLILKKTGRNELQEGEQSIQV